VEAVCGLGQAGGAPEKPHTTGQVPAREAAATRALRRSSPLEGMQTRITVLL
jgi:hypothetical protein